MMNEVLNHCQVEVRKVDPSLNFEPDEGFTQNEEILQADIKLKT